MVRIEKDHGKVPTKFLNKGATALSKLIKSHSDGEIEFKFDSKIYGEKNLKAELIRIQSGKCCFCESELRSVSHGDVEHFRPKAAYCIDDDPAYNYPGYYWLAYSYSNLFLACQICNQTYKKNYFPLEDEGDRANSHNDDIAKEKPLIVDPEQDDPSKHIRFVEHEAFPVKGSKKGAKTIERTGLNRAELMARRENVFGYMSLLADAARANSQEALDFIRESAQPNAQFSLMIRSNFPDLLA